MIFSPWYLHRKDTLLLLLYVLFSCLCEKWVPPSLYTERAPLYTDCKLDLARPGMFTATSKLRLWKWALISPQIHMGWTKSALISPQIQTKLSKSELRSFTQPNVRHATRRTPLLVVIRRRALSHETFCTWRVKNLIAHRAFGGSASLCKDQLLMQTVTPEAIDGIDPRHPCELASSLAMCRLRF